MSGAMAVALLPVHGVVAAPVEDAPAIVHRGDASLVDLMIPFEVPHTDELALALLGLVGPLPPPTDPRGIAFFPCDALAASQDAAAAVGGPRHDAGACVFPHR